MTHNDRFGLPLSLVEALRADPAPDANMLADLIGSGDDSGEDGDEDEAAGIAPPRTSKRPWAALAAGMALTVGFAAQGYAAGVSLQGDWRMAPSTSAFEEAVTGPAPDTARVTVAKDDAQRLTYQLVETRGGVEVARGVYDVSFTGAPSTSSVDGATLKVVARRDLDGGVLITAPAVGGLQASIHMKQTGADTALLEHAIRGADGSVAVERISLIRGDGR